MIEIDDLLGIPFVMHGRDINGFDCYGLVLEVEKRLGRKMVDLYKEYTSNNEKTLDENITNIIFGSKLVKIDEKDKKFGDVILFLDNKKRVCHIGVVLDKNDFIHCDCYGVRISDYTKYFRKGDFYTFGGQ